MKATLFASTVAAGLILTACSGDPAPSATVTVTAGPSASPAVTVTAPAPAEAAVADYDFDRFFDVTIGQSYTEASVTAHYPIAGEYQCPWLAPVIPYATDIGFSGVAVSRVDNPGVEIDTFFMRYYGTQAQALAVTMPTNAEGIRIGSSLADLQAAYPAMVESDPADSFEGLSHYTVQGPGTLTYRFAADDGWVNQIWWGPRPSLQRGDVCAL